jgi:ribulose-phosphate 3-epimerase
MEKNMITKFSHEQILVAPSILASDFSKLGEDCARVAEAGAKFLHLDIMDGHFVPNLTIGPPLIKSLRKVNDLFFDAHLMISDPLKYAPVFADAGADLITFHVEAVADAIPVIDAIHELGCAAGISVKPGTPAEALFPYLDKVELILIMTVEPGFGGQSFMADMMPKVKAVRKRIVELDVPVQLQVDGGIDHNTVGMAAAAGANNLVAGTFVFRNQNGAAWAIEQLHNAQSALDECLSDMKS